jgi:glycyl-tRNA synthetase
MNKHVTLEKIAALAKRRGFVFPASDIYGGMANTYDWGPYGVALKKNIERLWWSTFISGRNDMYGIDSSILLRPEVWEASGHTASFADVMVEDKVNHKRYRADHLIEEYYHKRREEIKVDGKSPEELGQMIVSLGIKSPDGNELTEPKRFNQLFSTEVGIISGEKNTAYLRGEIAQGLFLNFKNIYDTFHPLLPFGIGQSGKAFRNEITPGQFTFRTLEFDLMEFEYFFDKDKTSWEQLYESWKTEMIQFAKRLGIKGENMRWRAHEDFERSHYSSRTEDVEYEFPWGFKEMWGLAYRTDFDLKNHTEKSGKDLRYTYADGSKTLPHVIEPTFGLSRTATIVMMDAYTEEEVNGETRVVMKFAKSIAPVQVAVFPLLKDETLVSKAKEVYQKLKDNYTVEFENKGNIGKMYRRQDEIGTPYCITIDHQTLEDGTVTLRDRDTMEQERVKVEEIESKLVF